MVLQSPRKEESRIMKVVCMNGEVVDCITIFKCKKCSQEYRINVLDKESICIKCIVEANQIVPKKEKQNWREFFARCERRPMML
jgi:hypothetical protein